MDEVEAFIGFCTEDEEEGFDELFGAEALLGSTLVDVLHLFFGGLDTPRPDWSCVWRACTGD